MARNARGVMARAMSGGARGKGGRAGGKEGKRALGPRAQEAIREAASLSSSDPAGGSLKFLELATIAEGRGLPQVAAYLALRASEARVGAGDAAGAAEAARVAADHAAGISETKRVGRFFVRSLKKLKALDADAASEVSEYARKKLGLKKLPVPGERLKPNRAQRRALPKACPVCGHVHDTKTIEFEDDGTVDCTQCGGPLA